MEAELQIKEKPPKQMQERVPHGCCVANMNSSSTEMQEAQSRDPRWLIQNAGHIHSSEEILAGPNWTECSKLSESKQWGQNVETLKPIAMLDTGDAFKDFSPM